MSSLPLAADVAMQDQLGALTRDFGGGIQRWTDRLRLVSSIFYVVTTEQVRSDGERQS